MKFRIEAQLNSGLKRYRLQTDGSWRRMSSALSKNYPELCRDDDPSPNDQLYDTLLDAGLFIGTLSDKLKIDGQVYPIKDLEGGTLQELHARANVQPMVYRLTKPRRFTPDEIKAVIANGNDNINNALTLDLEGHVVLQQFSTKLLSNCLPIAVRLRAFCAGNDYVGLEAAKDNSHIQEQYIALLEGWTTHLMTGELNIMPEWEYTKSVEELWKEVDDITSHLK